MPQDETASTNRSADPDPNAAGSAERQVVWTLWFTYGVFYFCRTNLSAAVAGIKLPESEGGLGLSGEDVGWILASLKIAYGLGQLINGQLSERFRPRMLLAIGMFGSAVLNVVFGLGTGFFFLLFVWASNGYCQSLGWTPCMRVIGNWIPLHRRGKAIGLIGTGYQITLGLTYLVASQAVVLFGWRGAVFVPAGLLALSGIAMLFLLREEPEQSTEEPSGNEASAPPVERGSFRENLFLTLFNPALWLLGISLGLLNACRYGFLDWGLAHLLEVQRTSIDKAGLKFFLIAPGAVAGVYFTGIWTDRHFGGRRAPVIFGLMVLLGLMTLLYEFVARSTEAWAGVVLCGSLVVIGFCIYGPQVLLVGTAPADLAHRGTTAAAAGFVNFMGYMGAATGDVVTGYFSEESHGGWQVAIWIWAGWAFVGALCASLLWNASSERLGLLPRSAPRLVGSVALLAAVVSQWQGEFLDAKVLAFLVGTLLLLGTFVVWYTAFPAAVISAVGIVWLFASHVTGSSEDVSWQLAVGLASSGVALISSIMILTDER